MTAGTVEKKEKAAVALRLDGALTIYRAVELKQQILTAQAQGALEIDLSGVTEIDAAGVQLLMLAKRFASSQQQELRLVAPGPAVLELFELLSLATYFGDQLGAFDAPAAGTTPFQARQANES
ncbi:MAG: STAS domain-containing protein [Pseudomonadota bacterium]